MISGHPGPDTAGISFFEALAAWLQGAVDQWLPHGVEAKGEDFVRRARLVVTLSLSSSVALAGLAIALGFHNGFGTPVVACALGSVFVLGCPWILRATGSLGLAGNAITGLAFLVMSVSAFRTGGIGLPATFYAGMLPLTAALVSGKRSACVWSLIASAGLLGLHALHMDGYVFAEAPDPEAAYQTQLYGALALIFLLGSEAVLYEWLKRSAVDSLSDRNQSLEAATRELLDSRARSEAILEAAGEGILGLDLDGRVIFVNRAATQMIAATGDDLMGRPLQSVCHPSSKDSAHHARSDCAIALTLRDGVARAVRDDAFWRFDGLSLPVEYLSSPMCSPEGDLVGAVVTFRDASERRLVAEMGEILNKSLNEIYVFNAKSLRFVHANRGALNNLQYTIDELRDLTPLDLKPEFSIDDFEVLLAPLRESPEDSVKFTTAHRRKDGSSYPIEASVQTSTFQSEAVFLAIVVDITERQQLAAQLVQAQKMESIGQLAAGVAHEINTPIQFIGDNIQFLENVFQDLLVLEKAYGALYEASLKGPILPGLVEETAQAIEDADREYIVEEIPKAIAQSFDGVERVAKIVSAMKHFSHPGGGDIAENVDLVAAIESTLTVASTEWKYIAEIEKDFAANVPNVPGFRQELNQVILVLIVNAAHAIAESGATETNKGKITISTSLADEWAEVRVRDTGTGIPESARDKIFDLFFTTKKVGKGTGQGLAISYQSIVEKHGGELTFETEIGRGTTFIIRLPLEEAASETASG